MRNLEWVQFDPANFSSKTNRDALDRVKSNATHLIQEGRSYPTICKDRQRMDRKHHDKKKHLLQANHQLPSNREK